MLLDLPGAAPRLFGLGDAVVALSSNGAARVYRVESDKPVAKLSPRAPFFWGPSLAGPFVVGFGMGQILAWDARTLEKKWVAKEECASIYSMAATADTAVLAINGGNENVLVGIDAKDGTTLWRRPCTMRTRVFASGARFVVGDEAHVELVAGDSGKAVWSRALPASGLGERAIVAADARRIYVSGSPAGVALDAATGKDAETVAALEPLRPVELTADAIFGLAPALGSETLEAFDRATARRAWVMQIPHTSVGSLALLSARGDDEPPDLAYGRALAVDDDAVFVEGGDGVLRAHERATGALRWSWPLYAKSGSLAVLHAERAVSLYAVDAAGHVTVFKEGKAAPEHAVIDGSITVDHKPLAKGHVWLDHTRVDTDEAGHFKGALEATGNVRVAYQSHSFRGGKSCSVIGESVVPLTGKPTYEVALKLTTSCSSAGLGGLRGSGR
jgi:outer membrane protein assembly factor BamB